MPHIMIGAMVCAMNNPAHGGPCVPYRPPEAAVSRPVPGYVPYQISDQKPDRSYRPRPGDIGLTQISGWGGRGIRLAQWANGDGFTKFEHAFTVVTEEDTASSDPTIVEAMPGGAQHVSNWHDPAATVYIRCPDPLRSSVAAAALELVGTPYSFLDYGSLALHRFHIPAPLLRRYIRSSGHMICSQLCDRAALNGGWHLYADGRWEGDVIPGDLYRLYTLQLLN